MKRLIVAASLLCLTNAYAYEVKPIVTEPKLNRIKVFMGEVKLEEVEDCKYPSNKDNCRVDEHGQEHCAISQDSRC